ncbi:MAG: glutathione S-transferase family protein [Pseudomonadales bacterium]
MKLYSMPHSPYASRVRIQIYHKNLDIEILDPPGLREGTFSDIVPTAQVPALDTGATVLAESNVIMDYLEDIHPSKPMRPVDPEARAITSLLMRVADVRIAPALFPLFKEVMVKSGDQQAITDNIVALKAQLKLLDELFQFYGYKARDLSLADAALVPTIYFCLQVPGWFGEKDMLAGLDTLSAWWQWAQQQDAVAKVLLEIDEGLQVMLARLNA